MRRFLQCLLLLVILSLALTNLCAAQVTTGTPPFGSFGGGPFDTLNLANLNVHFAIPVIHKAGRGMPFTYDLSYDSSVWYPSNGGWQSTNNFGWRGDTEIATGYLSFTQFSSICPGTGIHDGRLRFTTTTFVYHDPFGTPHAFAGSAIDATECPTNDSRDENAAATDGSGYRLFFPGGNSSSSQSLTSPSGQVSIPPSGGATAGAAHATDANGNQISVNGTGAFTDTLGTTALTVAGSGTSSSPKTFTYTSPASSVAVTMHYVNKTVKTNFGCSGINEFGPTTIALVNDVTLADGSQYVFQYEPTPGYSGDVTGRISSVSLPTGGQIQYQYTGGNNGITCADGTIAGLTRTVSPGGTWSYGRTNVSGSQWKTTITDPTASQTVINFQGIYETQRQIYQGSATGTPLKTVANCYNATGTPAQSSCPTTAIVLPITRKTSFTDLPDTSGKISETDSIFTSLGLIQEVDDYDYGSGAVGSLIRKTITSYASLGNSIVDRPSSVVIQDSGGISQAQTSYFYDETTPVATLSCPNTGCTPQHVTITGSRGLLTTLSAKVDNSVTLYRKFSYYDTGNLSTSTDVSISNSANGPLTTYNYSSTNNASCGNSFVTSLSEPLSLSRSITWSCAGGVATSQTDENGQVASSSYTDPYFWRPASISDQLNNVTNANYPGPSVIETAMLFNTSNSSADDRRIKLDGLGRPNVVQKGQTPNPSSYDSTEIDYDAVGRPSKTTLPYSGAADALCSGSCPGTNTSYDGAGRVSSITDSGGKNVTFSYPANDIYQSITAPAGENAKRKQFEYDALGRLTSVCEITSGTSNISCGQSNPANGYLTSYAYDVLGNLKTVTQSNGGATQTRTYAYDMLGRLTSESNPESGTTTYAYDSVNSGTCVVTNAGDMILRTDASTIQTCNVYDALHRLLSVGHNPAWPNNTPDKHFVYDSATVNGVAMSNAKGRLAEAYTCLSPCTKITDEGFSYSARGEITDTWESTPNSGGYYHPTAGFWANGAVKSLWIASLPNITYGADSEGRTSTVSSSSGQNPVTSTNYNSFGEVTNVSFGSGDTDAFTFDPNSGRMTQYKYSVNGSSEIGNLTWNGNGSLKTLAITDPFNAGDAQTCDYAHDDLSRLASVNCGSTWAQTFTYDPFGNITKSGSISWQPGYTSNTNRYSLGGTSYDANGNLLNDTFHSYSWSAYGKPSAIDTIGLTYDALDRMVEQNQSGTFYQIVYTPLGSKLGLFKGQTIQQLYLPLPGGAQAEYLSWGLSHYRHADWLGSNRLESSTTRTILDNNAYAPFGEPYVQTGNGEISFTGQNKDTDWLQYDFLARQYDPKQGRWISPDPAGLGAVDPSDPQSWNRYVYVVNNPLSFVDPLGLKTICDDSGNCYTDVFGGGTGGGGGGLIAIWGNFSGGVCAMFGVLCGDRLGTGIPDGGNGARGAAKPGSKPKPTNNGNCTASSGATSIVTGNATTNAPTITAGAAVGEWIGGPPGAFLGGILGSFFGVGGTASYVPSTKSLYAGPTVVFAPALMGGNGISGTVSSVPSSQNPNSIASSWTFSVSFQPNPILGSTVIKSPGSGPPVVGPSVGTRVPVSFGVSYSVPVKKGGC